MLEQRTTDTQWLVGTLLGERYRVDKVLAQGTLCAVYGGEDTGLNRPIAIKAVPAAHLAAYRAALAATTTLAHSAAVIVLDALERDGWLFLIQEHVNGVALSELLDDGYSADLAVGMGVQIARLLAYTHSRGTIHGDLTPSAVMVERDHIIRVNNFCLPPDQGYFARYGDVAGHLMRGLSLPGAALASGSGMPPLATPEADVWALGLLLWQALTTTSSNGHLHDFRADVPAIVRDLVGRILVPSHPRRLTTAIEVVPAIEAVSQALLAGREQDTQPTPPLLRRSRQSRERMEAEQAWSEEETIVNPQSSSQPLYPGAPGGSPPAYVPGHAPGYPPGATRPAMPAVNSGPLRGSAPSGPYGPAGAPGSSGPLQQPAPPPPMVYRSSLSGPLRLPTPSGQTPGQTPGQAGPRAANPTRRLSGPNSAPHPGAPNPLITQRLPAYTGPLSGPAGAARANTSGRLDATGPMPAYRPPVALPWREDPRVAEWASPTSRPTALAPGARSAHSWPLVSPRRPAGLGLLPAILIGLMVLAAFFVVGYLVPYILPFH